MEALPLILKVLGERKASLEASAMTQPRTELEMAHARGEYAGITWALRTVEAAISGRLDNAPDPKPSDPETIEKELWA